MTSGLSLRKIQNTPTHTTPPLRVLSDMVHADVLVGTDAALPLAAAWLGAHRLLLLSGGDGGGGGNAATRRPCPRGAVEWDAFLALAPEEQTALLKAHHQV